MGIRGQALLALLVLFSGFQSFAENKLANTARETLAFPGFQPPPAPAIGPGRCQITARAPDLVTPWGTWKVKSVDVDENFILLHYNNTNAPSRPGFFQNYILVWLKGTNIGPWVVYAGNATLYNPRVSSLGHVAVRRYSPGSPYPEEQLVVCPFDLNRGIGQWDPYACAVDPTQAIVVNTTPYNQPLGNIPNSLPDGDISSWDWSGDYLAYANRSISQGFSGISDWSLQTLSDNPIAGGFSPQIRYVVNTYSGNRILSYSDILVSGAIFSPGLSVYANYSGAYANGSGFTSVSPFYSESALGSFSVFSTTTNAFFDVGNDWHAIYAQRSSSGYGIDVFYKSSSDGYTNSYPLAYSGPSNTTYYSPRKIDFTGQSFLVMEARPQGGQTHLELYNAQNTGYSLNQTIGASAPNLSLYLRGASSNTLLAAESNGTSSQDRYVMLECQ